MLGGALGVVLRRNPVHCALSLVLTLFGIAVLFVAQDANFLAAVQVIVYAGAIVVLFLFVIMLLGVDRAEDLRVEPFKVQRPVAVVIGARHRRPRRHGRADRRRRDRRAITGEQSVGGDARPAASPTSTSSAESLFSDYVFAFEVTSILLIVAVIGDGDPGPPPVPGRPAEPSSRRVDGRRRRRRRPATGRGAAVMLAELATPTPTWYLAPGGRRCSPSARSACSSGATRS